MAEKAVFFLSFFFHFLCISTCKEAEVFCAVGAECILPCSFNPGFYIALHWKKSQGDTKVHSYYNHQDQLHNQHQDYTNRAFLFYEKINRGNASLLLKGVKVQDEGSYWCFTNTNTESKISTVNLKVFVKRFKVDVVKQDSELICRSEGLYPEPTVTWYTGRPLTEIEGSSTVRQREDQLYDTYSSVPLHSVFTAYSCNVSTALYWRSSEITEESPLGVFYSDAVLRCPISKAPKERVMWKFNHTQRIVSWTGMKRVYNESWRPSVDALTDSNSLVLKDLTLDQEGHYSCHISTDQQTFVSTIYLKIQLMQLFAQISEDAAADLELIVVWIIGALIIFGISYSCA